VNRFRDLSGSECRGLLPAQVRIWISTDKRACQRRFSRTAGLRDSSRHAISVPIPLRTTCRREMIASLIFCGQLALFDNCHSCRMLSRSFAVPLNRELLPLQAVVLILASLCRLKFSRSCILETGDRRHDLSAVDTPSTHGKFVPRNSLPLR